MDGTKCTTAFVYFGELLVFHESKTVLSNHDAVMAS